MRNDQAVPTILKPWTPLIITAAMLFGFQSASLLFPPIGELLEWSRTEMAQGQWWRLLTGHWIHLGFIHLTLNLAGLALLTVLFERPIPVAWWIGYLFAAPVALSLGLLLAVPELDWYRGFSGCLHGIFVMLALINLPRTPWWSGLLLAGLIIKLVAEAISPSGTAELIGAAVIYQVHWLGAVAGLAPGLMLLLMARQAARERQAQSSPE